MPTMHQPSTHTPSSVATPRPERAGQRRRFIRAGALAAASALCAALAACGIDSGESGSAAQSDSDSDSGRDIVIGMSGDPSSLDAQLSDDRTLPTWSVNEGLVDLNVEGEVVPVLATKVPTMSKDDPTRWRVELREGITFTNGEPFDAEAVKANVERIMDPDYGSTFVSELPTLKGAEVVDEHTVDLVTSAPDPILDVRLRVLRMVPPKAAQSKDYGEKTAIGTGPMMIERWEKGQRILMKRNPDYWGDDPAAVDEAELRIIPDVTTRLSALQAGEIDIADTLPTDQLASVPQVIKSATPVEVGTHRFNLTKFPYSDPNFRRALNYAVDKEELNEGLFGGEATINNCQPVTPESGGFNPDLKPYPYDPDKARQLLAKVDLPPNFTLHFDGTTGVYQSDREAGQALVSYWEDIGLEVDAVFDDYDTYLDKIFDPESPFIYAQPDMAFGHAARQIEMYYTPKGSTAAVGDAYPELGPLVEAASTSPDEAEREQAYHRIFELGCKDAFFVYTLDLYDVWGAADGVHYDPGFGALEKFAFNRLSFDDESEEGSS